MVDVRRAVLQEDVVSRDQVAVEDDEAGRLPVEHLVHHLDGADILLRSPRLPGIWP